MNNSKKSFLSIMGLLMITGTVNAQVVDGSMMHPMQQGGEFPANMPNMIPPMPVMEKGAPMNFFMDEQKDDAVLFKVHDINPVNEKKDGVEACDFYVTFYNRSPKDINGAVLDLTWIDNSLIEVINDERDENQDKNNKSGNVDSRSSVSESAHPIDLTATIDMPALKSYKQITTRSRIKTDRCFLLLEDLALNVRSCNAKNEPSAPSGQIISGGGMGGNQGCNGLFRFISSKSPEYYVEFKNISYDEQKAEERQQRASEEQELESKYRTAVDGFGRLSSTLAEIK